MASITHAFLPETQRRIAGLLLGLGTTLLVAAMWQLYVESTFIQRAKSTSGTVISVSGNSRTPIVGFVVDSKTFRLRPTSSDSFHQYSVGDSVLVLYLESNPDFAKLDQFLHLWSNSTALLFGGAFAILFGWFTATGRGSWGPLKQARIVGDGDS